MAMEPQKGSTNVKGEVQLTISSEETPKGSTSIDLGSAASKQIWPNSPIKESGNATMSYPSPEISRYLENNPQNWHPNHSVVVKEIENVNKLKTALYCNHTMNFQEYAEKNKRRTELVIHITCKQRL